MARGRKHSSKSVGVLRTKTRAQILHPVNVIVRWFKSHGKVSKVSQALKWKHGRWRSQWSFAENVLLLQKVLEVVVQAVLFLCRSCCSQCLHPWMWIQATCTVTRTEQVLFESSLSVLYTACKPAGKPGLSPPVARLCELHFPDHYSTKRECVVGKRLESASRL